MASDRLFGYRLDLVEWVVLVVVGAVVAATLINLSFTGPGVIFVVAIPTGLLSVGVLRRFRPSTVHQPPSAPIRGEWSALLSLVLFAVGALVGIMALFASLAAFAAPKVDAGVASAAASGVLVAAALFFAGVRLRRGS
jgi:hypothetical protein